MAQATRSWKLQSSNSTDQQRQQQYHKINNSSSNNDCHVPLPRRRTTITIMQEPKSGCQQAIHST
jgi:hypothetical protein